MEIDEEDIASSQRVIIPQLPILKIFKVIFISRICVLLACLSVCYIHAWWPQRSEEEVRSPGTGVADECELPWRCCSQTHGL